MTDPENENPFEGYSLRGQGEKLSENAGQPEYLLGSLCLKGQATVIYAKYNTGKTLLLLHLITEAIFEGRIRGEDVIYINADDDEPGLAAKVKILEQHGAHMLAPGHRGFKNSRLVEILEEMIKNDQLLG